MKIKSLIVLIAVTIIIDSCKKSDTASTPTPPIPVTTDSLGSWQKINPGITQNDILDVWFTDAATGYICGDNYIAKSIDSGKTWKPTAFSNPYYNLFFYNADDGFALGEQTIAITKDAGNTWQEKNATPALSSTIGDIYFTSPSTGYVRTTTGIYKTTDTCNTWQLSYPGNILGLYFFDSNNGNIIAGGNSLDTALTTTNGGTSWQVKGTFHPLGSNPQYYSVLQFTDNNTGWFNFGQNLYKTIDGGSNWVTTNPADTVIQDINFIDASNGYIATTANIFKTTDGGNSWQNVCQLATPSIIEIEFIDINTGWACGFGASGIPLLLRFKQ